MADISISLGFWCFLWAFWFACQHFLKMIAAFKIWSAIFHESQYICSVSSWMPEDNFQVCSLSCAGVGGVCSRGRSYLNKPKLIFNQNTLICNIVDYANVNHTQQIQRLIICQNIIFWQFWRLLYKAFGIYLSLWVFPKYGLQKMAAFKLVLELMLPILNLIPMDYTSSSLNLLNMEVVLFKLQSIWNEMFPWHFHSFSCHLMDCMKI